MQRFMALVASVQRLAALPARGTRRRGLVASAGRKGSVALEFAVVSVPFILMVLGAIEFGYVYYAQQALDYATEFAARQIQIGAVQAAAPTPAQFVTNTVCPALSGLLPCAAVAVDVEVVGDYWSTVAGQVPATNGNFSPSSFKFCPGAAGQLVLVQAYYPAPSFLTSWLPTWTVRYSGSSVHMVVSTAAFMNEQFPGGVVGTGC